MKIKKILLIIGLIIVAFVVATGVWDRLSGRYADRMEVQKFYRESREDAARQIAEINTSLSYLLERDGTIYTFPASPRIELKINGSNQPLRGKAPLSFTLSWKIDPRIKLDDCRIDGPSVRAGYYNEVWGYDMARWRTNTSDFLDAHIGDFIKAYGGYEGSLEFKDVVPAKYGPDDDRNDLEELSKVPLYHGVASFYPGRPGIIELTCGWGYLSEDAAVGVWIDQ